MYAHAEDIPGKRVGPTGLTFFSRGRGGGKPTSLNLFQVQVLLLRAASITPGQKFSLSNFAPEPKIRGSHRAIFFPSNFCSWALVSSHQAEKFKVQTLPFATEPKIYVGWGGGGRGASPLLCVSSASSHMRTEKFDSFDGKTSAITKGPYMCQGLSLGRLFCDSQTSGFSEVGIGGGSNRVCPLFVLL